MTAFGKPLRQGLDILEALVQAPEPLGFAALRNQVDTSPASFSRFLRILVERGYVAQADGLYTTGPRLAGMGLVAHERLPLRSAAEPALQALLQSTQESVEVAQFSAAEFMFLQRYDSPQAVVLRARPGHRFAISMHTAIGRIAYAFGAAPQPAACEAQLATVRQSAVCSLLQNERQVLRIAAPLFTADASCLGCLTIAAPAFRITPASQAHFEQLLHDQAHQTSAALGYAGTYPPASPAQKQSLQER